jgi:hypothetical protein
MADARPNRMRTRHLLAALLFAVLMSCAPAALAQAEAFRFDLAKVPAGRAFHFVKSQRDGSHVARISVYLPSFDRIEALKWDEGGTEATLVTAEMDWPRFSVRRFEGWRLAHGSAPERKVTMEVIGERLSMSLMAQPISLGHWPWHSYDFDFTSLNLCLPHLVSPEDAVTFWRTDFVYGDPPSVAEIGAVTMRYEGRERRNGKSVRRYSIGGPGLGGLAGTWWADAHSGLLVEYELPLGDEPGYRDVRLRLESSRVLSPTQWATFKRRAVGD